VTTFLVLFLLVPLISFVLRVRKRKRLRDIGASAAAAASLGSVLGPASAPMASASNAELVRRRLQVTGGGAESGLFGRAWGEVARVVGDTVRMAGSGLV